MEILVAIDTNIFLTCTRTLKSSGRRKLHLGLAQSLIKRDASSWQVEKILKTDIPEAKENHRETAAWLV